MRPVERLVIFRADAPVGELKTLSNKLGRALQTGKPLEDNETFFFDLTYFPVSVKDDEAFGAEYTHIPEGYIKGVVLCYEFGRSEVLDSHGRIGLAYHEPNSGYEFYSGKLEVVDSANGRYATLCVHGTVAASSMPGPPRVQISASNLAMARHIQRLWQQGGSFNFPSS